MSLFEGVFLGTLSLPLGAVDGGEDGAQRSHVDVVGHADTPVELAVALILQQDVGGGLGVGSCVPITPSHPWLHGQAKISLKPKLLNFSRLVGLCP